MLFCYLLLAFPVSEHILWQTRRETFKTIQNYFGKNVQLQKHILQIFMYPKMFRLALTCNWILFYS